MNVGLHFSLQCITLDYTTYSALDVVELCLGDACHQLTNAEGRPNTEHRKETLEPTTAAPTVVEVVAFEDELPKNEK